jgi:integrase
MAFKIYKVVEEPLFIEFCENRNLSDSTIINYKKGLQKYSDFTGLTLEELIKEAEEEEDSRIRMRKRKIKKYLNDYSQTLKDAGHKEGYIRKLIIEVRTFYNEFDIEIPINNKRKLRSDKKETGISEIPTMEDIEYFMEHVTANYKAIITLMLSSGMSKAEISSLTFKHFYNAIPLEDYPEDIPSIIKAVRKKENLVPIWNIVRIKTNHPYFTFSSPESLERILTYLEELHTLDAEYIPKPSDTLFRSLSKKDTSLKSRGISSAFLKTCKKYNLRKVNDYCIMRSHNLRKFFATTLERNKVSHLTTKWLLGHTIEPTTSAYFKADPEALKEQYIEVLDQLTTSKVQVMVVDKYESLTQELEDIKEELAYVKTKINPDLVKKIGIEKRRYRFHDETEK